MKLGTGQVLKPEGLQARLKVMSPSSAEEPLLICGDLICSLEGIPESYRIPNLTCPLETLSVLETLSSLGDSVPAAKSKNRHRLQMSVTHSVPPSSHLEN